MDRQGPQGFWINIAGQRPAMESAGARNPDDPTQAATPAPRPRRPDSPLDGEKTGAALLFSGVFLALVGVTFTVTGWRRYQADSSFECTQLLGPVLISVGGTFVLTGICEFGVSSCWACGRRDGEATPAMEQTPGGRSCASSGMSPPVVLHHTTTMLCLPPAYNFITQDVRQAPGFPPSVRAAPPPRDAVYSADNAAFAAEEDGTARRAETGVRGSRTGKTEGERARGDGSGSTCARPPAYEDIYPPSHRHGPS